MSAQFSFDLSSGGEPLPVVQLALLKDGGRASLALNAIVDTGSDGTLIPVSVLAEAGYRPSRRRMRLVSGWQDPQEEIVAGYVVDLRLASIKLSDVDVYGSRQIPTVILGRNILNLLRFIYDGPRRLLDIEVPVSQRG